MSYVKIPVFHFYEKMNEGQLKMARFRYSMTQMLAGLILESKEMHMIF